MRIRDDLLKNQPGSRWLQELVSVISAFLEQRNSMSLLIKGPWGCGKTASVASALKHLADSNHPKLKTYAFASLSGTSEISDERRLFVRGTRRIAGIENTATRGTWAKWLHLLGKSGPSPISALSQLIEDAAGEWMKDGLLVIDDLERRGDLPMQKVFGLITRVTEIQECRVIVLCNEDRLSDEDSAHLASQREKVFDSEYRYEPELEDSIAAVVQDERRRSSILKALAAVGSRSLRCAIKIDTALDQVLLILKGLDSTLLEEVARNLPIFAAVKYGLGRNISAQEMLDAWGAQLWQPPDSSSEQVELTRIVDVLHYKPSKLDGLIVSLLCDGWVPKEQIASVCADAIRQREGAAIEADLETLIEAATSSFSKIEDRTIEAVERRLREDLPRLTVQQLQDAIFGMRLAKGQEFAAADYEKEWAKSAQLETIEFDLLDRLESTEARQIVRERINAKLPAEQPATFIEVIYSQREHGLSMILGDTRFENSDWVQSELKSASGERMLQNVRVLLEKFRERMSNPNTSVEDLKRITNLYKVFEASVISVTNDSEAKRDFVLRGIKSLS